MIVTKRKGTCQTSTIAHPGHAPKGKTATIGAEIITTLYTAPLARSTATLAGRPRVMNKVTRGLSALE